MNIAQGKSQTPPVIGRLWIGVATAPPACFCSAPQSTPSTAVLVPGRHKQAGKGDGDQTKDDSAEKRFDHLVAAVIRITQNYLIGSSAGRCSLHQLQLNSRMVFAG